MSVDAEAAASLFGDADAASDPFSADLGDSNPPGEPSTSAADGSEHDPFSGAGSSVPTDSSELFSSDAGLSSDAQAFDNLSSWSDTQNNDIYGTQTSTHAYVNEFDIAGQSQGGYDPSGQWYGYGQPTQTNSEGYAMQAAAPSYSQTLPSGSHDPYTPNTWNTSASSTYGSSQYVPSAPSSSMYDPYQPMGATTSAPVQPPMSSSSQAAYNPYQPSNSAYNPYKPSPSGYTTGQQSVSPFAVSVPPPPQAVRQTNGPTSEGQPARTAAAYRPKTMNAYDPPIPPPKSKPRAVPISPHPALSTFPGSPSAHSVTSPLSPPPSRSSSASLYGPGQPAAQPAYGPPPRANSLQTPPPRASLSPVGYGGMNGSSISSSAPTWSYMNGSAFTDAPVANGRSPYLPPTSLPSGTLDTTTTQSVADSLPTQPTVLPPTQEEPFLPDIESSSGEETAHAHPTQAPDMPWGAPDAGAVTPRVPQDEATSPAVNVPAPYDPYRPQSTEAHANGYQASIRSASPGVASWSGSQTGSPSRVASPSGSLQYKQQQDPYKPAATTERRSLESHTGSGSRASSPLPASIYGGTTTSRSHAPSIASSYDPPYRAASPGSTSIKSWQGSMFSNPDPYAPSSRPSSAVQPSLRDRAMSNGSMLSTLSAPMEDPYSPTRQSRRETSEISDYGDQWRRHPGMPSQEVSPQFVNDSAQEVLLKAPTQAPYAPSPTLLGANDPLGRTSARAPVISFGFGGKLVTCFHGSSNLSTGFDVALSSRQTTDVHMRVLHKVLPESVLDIVAPTYPGPLFSDPGTPTTASLVRTTASQVKAKKARLTKYLEEREEEVSRAVDYLTSGTLERKQAEGKLTLVKLLKVMVENEGRLSGSPSVDAAVRAALVPRLADTHANGVQEVLSDAASISSYPGLGLTVSEPGEPPVASYSVTASALDKIQDFLVRGERRKAYHFALDEKLWAHAMLIASSIDKDAWKEVVTEFVRTELGVKNDTSIIAASAKAGGPSPATANGRESLRVAYSLFAGQGAGSVHELIPPKLLIGTRVTEGLLAPQPAISHITPVSPNFPQPSVTASVPLDALETWAETVAMMLSSPLTPEASTALTALGDFLVSKQWTAAAHVCYLLSPQTSPMGGVGTPSVRVVLLGSQSPHISTLFSKDADPVIFSEIAEFALSQVTPPKGQDPFAGFPHLQAYRLMRASYLAEFGYVQLANRYCEAIRASLTKQSPYYNPVLLHKLRELSDHLTGAPQLDKNGSWIRGKMAKPSLDSIGNWLEGRFTKFIAGDGDASPPATDQVPGHGQNGYSGPFTHYSAISSAVPSASPSPQPSLHSLGPSPPPRRSGSAMALRPPANHAPTERASSAMDYSRPPAMNAYEPPKANQNGYGAYANGAASEAAAEDNGAWWGSSYTTETETVTPTATTFLQSTDAPAADTGQFISLMDDPGLSVSPAPVPAPAPSHSHRIDEEDDLEDLGFGNSKKRAETSDNISTGDSESSTNTEKPKSKEEAASAAPPVKPPLNSSSSGSWLSRWWKRDSGTPGPVKANLGEEVSFYYDQELKRWVNKNSSGEAAQPKPPPPPPSRAQTASPGRAGGPKPTPPPARPASATVSSVDLMPGPPHRPPMRIRSNLVPDDAGGPSAPNTPGPPLTPGPPPTPGGRPRSQMSKRPARSRYVDVFQQPGAS